MRWIDQAAHTPGPGTSKQINETLSVMMVENTPLLGQAGVHKSPASTYLQNLGLDLIQTEEAKLIVARHEKSWRTPQKPKIAN